MQLDLIAEEYQEFRKSHMMEGPEETLKELSDLIYVCFQYAENTEWDIEEALRRVHRSNMSKLGLDGKPIRRADGKVLKGPNYQPPTLFDLVWCHPLLFHEPEEYSHGWITLTLGCRYHVRSSRLKTQWKDQMESKQAGALLATLLEMEQVARPPVEA